MSTTHAASKGCLLILISNIIISQTSTQFYPCNNYVSQVETFLFTLMKRKIMAGDVSVSWRSFLSFVPFELAALEIKGSMDNCKQRRSTYKMMYIRN